MVTDVTPLTFDTDKENESLSFEDPSEVSRAHNRPCPQRIASCEILGRPRCLLEHLPELGRQKRGSALLTVWTRACLLRANRG